MVPLYFLLGIVIECMGLFDVVGADSLFLCKDCLKNYFVAEYSRRVDILLKISLRTTNLWKTSLSSTGCFIRQ